MDLNVFRLRHTAKLPKRAHDGDAGMDFYFCRKESGAKSIPIYPGETVLFPTGIKVEIPKGYMLEIKNTGWMSNRGRQNVASYFAKEIKLDWRIGAAYFESMLIDYDVHSNYGNWMYVSGVGNDPRDRKFNIKWQSEKYDPKMKYQNLWLND